MLLGTMRPQPAHRRASIWLTVLALLLSALAPLLAHALTTQRQGEARVEVCTASGMVWLAADQGQDESPDASDEGAPARSMPTDCAWCLLHHHGGTQALPPPQTSISLGDAARPPLAAFRPEPLAGSPVWHPAQSRAPPLSR